jgi:hypothetical protein
MKRLTEIFKYGDSESIEIFLALLVIGEVTFLSSKWINPVDVLSGLLMALIILSVSVLCLASYLVNCFVRKWAAYFSFICLTGMIIYLVDHKIGDIGYYVLLGFQALGFIWIAWKNAIEERWKKSSIK